MEGEVISPFRSAGQAGSRGKKKSEGKGGKAV